MLVWKPISLTANVDYEDAPLGRSSLMKFRFRMLIIWSITVAVVCEYIYPRPPQGGMEASLSSWLLRRYTTEFHTEIWISIPKSSKFKFFWSCPEKRYIQSVPEQSIPKNLLLVNKMENGVELIFDFRVWVWIFFASIKRLNNKLPAAVSFILLPFLSNKVCL